MNTAITTIYTITDDWLKSRRHKESAQCTVSDAEVMTVAITAVRFFHGNYAKTWRYLMEERYMLRCLSESQFNRRLRRIHHLFDALFQQLAVCWKRLSEEDIFLIDSFPVPVCDNIRINDCHIYPSDATDDAFRGYIASKRRYFYGLKVHLMTDEHGRPVEASLKPGSRSDTGQLRNFEFDLPEGATAYADKAYGWVLHRRHAGRGLLHQFLTDPKEQLDATGLRSRELPSGRVSKAHRDDLQPNRSADADVDSRDHGGGIRAQSLPVRARFQLQRVLLGHKVGYVEERESEKTGPQKGANPAKSPRSGSFLRGQILITKCMKIRLVRDGVCQLHGIHPAYPIPSGALQRSRSRIMHVPGSVRPPRAT